MNPQQNSVPRLDLAPKLNRPLSLRNPLDYLRLLYWVFYFPQALRRYVKTFGNQEKENSESKSEYYKPWQKAWVWLREHSIDCQLYIQGLVLTLIAPVLIAGCLELIGIPIYSGDIMVGVAFGVAIGVLFGITYSVMKSATGGVMTAVALSVVGGVVASVVYGVMGGMTASMVAEVAAGVTEDVGFSVMIHLADGVKICLMSGVTLSVICGVASVGDLKGVLKGVAFSIMDAVGFGMMYSVAVGVMVGVMFGMIPGVAFGVIYGVAFGVGIWRPDNLLFSLPISFLKPWNKGWGFVHVTAIPVWGLTSQVKTWLRQDWQTGVHNVNQLLAYTLQFIPVVTAVNQVLKESSSDQIIWRVAQLAENPYDWDLLRYASASLSAEIKLKVLDIPGLPSLVKQKIQNRFIADIRLDTHPRAVAAGFWYLHKKEAEKAAQAFAVVRELLYGEEMYLLARTLAVFSQYQHPHTIALSSECKILKLTSIPPLEQRFRPATWQVISFLHNVLDEVCNIQKKSDDLNARSLAVKITQAELQTILEEKDNIPQPERELIVKIAQNWQDALLKNAG
jgi:hypothetical protein